MHYHKTMRKLFNNTMNTICCKMRHHSEWYGKTGKSPCTRLATYTNGTHYFCTHHSGMQRYIVRDGDVGEIIKRFDSEQELRDNIHEYPGMRMQKLTHSHRRDIY